MIENTRNGDSADTPLDPELAGIYRAAAREEPPQHVDAAILAAARRAARSQPRSLDESTPGGAAAPADPGAVRHTAAAGRRWQLPLALAAVLVLSVSIVTLQREAGDLAPAPSRGEPPAGAVELRDAPEPAEPRAPPLARKAPERQQEALRAETGPKEPARSDAAENRRSAAPTPAEGREAERGSSALDQTLPAPQSARPERAPAERAAPAAAASLRAVEPPEKWGEKILDLRRQGRAAEADALLAEFRQHYPEHAVPDEWLR